MPFPKPFLQGLDRVKFYDTTGMTYGNIYLNGELRVNKGRQFSGFKGYFLYCIFYKMPIATLLFLILATIQYFRKNLNRDWLQNEVFIFAPILFYLFFYNFGFNSNIGIRYIIVIFPMLYIFCGNLLKDWESIETKSKVVYLGLLVYLSISVASYYPHYLSYFNEFVWDRTKAYKYLADSNIDWGQNRWYLSQYLKTDNSSVVEPDIPTSGRIIVGVNNLVGIRHPQRFRWLRENFEPIGHITYSYLIFDVPESFCLECEKQR